MVMESDTLLLMAPLLPSAHRPLTHPNVTLGILVYVMSRHIGVPSLGESLQSSHFVAFYLTVDGSVCDSSSYVCGYG